MRFVLDFDPFGSTAPAATGPATPAVPPNGYNALPFYLPLVQCTACPVRAEATQVVPGQGPLDAQLLVIGQNPGEEEDRLGAPFVGQGGQELDAWFRVLGLDRARAVTTNVVKCHTSRNRVPKTSEIKVCSNLWLANELQHLDRAAVLFTLGKPATVCILGPQAPPATPLLVHHFRIRVFGRELSVFPMPHPAYLLRVANLKPVWYETLLPQIRQTLQRDFPLVFEATRRV